MCARVVPVQSKGTPDVTYDRPPNHAMFDTARASRRAAPTRAHAPADRPEADALARNTTAGRTASWSPTTLRHLMALQQQHALIAQQQQQQALAQLATSLFPAVAAPSPYMAFPGLFPVPPPAAAFTPTLPAAQAAAPAAAPVTAPVGAGGNTGAWSVGFEDMDAFWAAVEARRAIPPDHLDRAKAAFTTEGILVGALPTLTDGDLEVLGVGRFHRPTIIDVIKRGPTKI